MGMNDFVGLTTQDKDHFVYMIEASLKINKRFQFFLWAQGALQGFIPHETLLCAYGDIARMRFKYEIFSSISLGEQVERDVGDPLEGVLPRVVDGWLHGGCQPCLFHPEKDVHSCSSDLHERAQKDRKLLADMKRCGFAHVAAHGAREVKGEYGSFFMFVREPSPHTERDIYLLELLMPYLHMALHRMLANESSERTPAVSVEPLLSKREIQVLQWVKNGKTNQEIGQILDISPLTVKNHVQKILRKLNVSNRAQAVGKGAVSRLFSSHDAG